MSRAFIQFLTLDDYLGYLRAHNLKETHLELSSEESMGSRNDISFVAVASANVSDKVVQCTIFLGKESSFSFIEKDESKSAGIKSTIKDQFEAIQANLKLKGWVVFSGTWSFKD